MNLNDAKNLVQETSKGMKSMGTSLENAKSARNELTRELANARRRLKRKKEGTFYPTKLAQEIIKSLKKGNFLSSILIQEIDKAVEGNLEFGRDEYRQTLYQVALEQDIYKLIPEGTGWNIQLRPEIVFEEEAGQLDDWARGISAYRAELKTKIGEPGSYIGLRATEWWEEHVFGTVLQTKTFRSRLDNSGFPDGAPFWEILNNGSQPMSSDRPDESYNPYPTSPTDFVGDAERAIRAEFRELMLPERERWFQEARELEGEILEATEIRDGFSSDIRKLSTEFRRNKSVLDSLGERARYVDENKLAEAIRRLRAGEEFETPTVELTARGAGRRIRISVRKLEGLIYD